MPDIKLILFMVCILILCVVISFFIMVLIGNLSAMKFLAKHGVAVFSHNIIKDSKLLNYVNKEGIAWLKIPEICYSPIMENSDGKYRNHNFLQKENRYGELYVSNNKSAQALKDFAIKTDNVIQDLTIIKGSPFGNGTDLRHANFSLLRKIKYNIKDGTPITLCENGKLRYFKAFSMLETGIEEKLVFKYTNREEFLKSFLFLSNTSNIIRVPKETVIFLECRTDIDLVMIMLVEVNKKENSDEKK